MKNVSKSKLLASVEPINWTLKEEEEEEEEEEEVEKII